MVFVRFSAVTLPTQETEKVPTLHLNRSYTYIYISQIILPWAHDKKKHLGMPLKALVWMFVVTVISFFVSTVLFVANLMAMVCWIAPLCRQSAAVHAAPHGLGLFAIGVPGAVVWPCWSRCWTVTVRKSRQTWHSLLRKNPSSIFRLFFMLT